MERLYREARSAAALDHPNICTIYEINETDDGQLYLVMARYEGETLKERIASGSLSVVEVSPPSTGPASNRPSRISDSPKSLVVPM